MNLNGKDLEGEEGAVVRREPRPKREKQEKTNVKNLPASSRPYAPNAEVSIPRRSFKCRPDTMCLCLGVVSRTISEANDF